MPNRLRNTGRHATAYVSALALALGAAAATLVSCRGDDHNAPATAQVTPADTAVTRTSAVTPATGVGAAVTATDMGAVAEANEYLITPAKWASYMKANERLARLSASDRGVATYLADSAQGVGAATLDAGVKRLDANPQVHNAIASAGMSTRDYLVMSVAVASASRYMNDPKAAPPTPATRDNAEFLRAHAADVQRLERMDRKE